MSPEEVRDAQRKMLAGILLKDGCEFDVASHFKSQRKDPSRVWLDEVYRPAVRAKLFVCTTEHPFEWVVTEKGKKFLLEE